MFNLLNRLRRATLGSPEASGGPAKAAAAPRTVARRPPSNIIFGDAPDNTLDLHTVRGIAHALNERLPVELVGRIFTLAGFAERSASYEWNTETRIICQNEGGPIASISCFVTPEALSADLAAHLAYIRVRTLCRHQGYVSFPEHGSYSWISIACTDHEDTARMEQESHRLSITRHYNFAVDGAFEWEDGGLIELKDAREGDFLQIRANAQFPGWSCLVRAGRLELYRRLDVEKLWK